MLQYGSNIIFGLAYEISLPPIFIALLETSVSFFLLQCLQCLLSFFDILSYSLHHLHLYQQHGYFPSFSILLVSIFSHFINFISIMFVVLICLQHLIFFDVRIKLSVLNANRYFYHLVLLLLYYKTISTFYYCNYCYLLKSLSG